MLQQPKKKKTQKTNLIRGTGLKAVTLYPTQLLLECENSPLFFQTSEETIKFANLRKQESGVYIALDLLKGSNK